MFEALVIKRLLKISRTIMDVHDSQDYLFFIILSMAMDESGLRLSFSAAAEKVPINNTFFPYSATAHLFFY